MVREVSIPELLTAYLRVRSHTTKQQFARAIGIRPSSFSNLLKGERPGVETCLRIAHVTGATPAEVLRAAGHGEIAALLETVYGVAPAAPPAALSLADREHLERWHALPLHVRRAFERIERSFLEILTEPDGEPISRTA